MSKDIEIANGQEDQVSEAVQRPESGGAVLHDLDDPIEAFAYRIGQRSVDERDDVLEVLAQCGDEDPQRRNAASELPKPEAGTVFLKKRCWG